MIVQSQLVRYACGKIWSPVVIYNYKVRLVDSNFAGLDDILSLLGTYFMRAFQYCLWIFCISIGKKVRRVRGGGAVHPPPSLQEVVKNFCIKNRIKDDHSFKKKEKMLKIVLISKCKIMKMSLTKCGITWHKSGQGWQSG